MQETKDLAPFELERRLMEEINILRLEGSLFCFDPRAAKRRSGTLTLADARKKPVSLRIDANYGQPSVLAYKVLQGIFLKLTEEGCELSEDGRCLYSDTVSFSARELAMLTGPLMERAHIRAAPPGNHAAAPHGRRRVAL